MGAVAIQVARAAEGLLPGGVVKADIAVEGHPVIDMGPVGLAGEVDIRGAVGDGEGSAGGAIALILSTSDNGCFQDALSVDNQEKPLGSLIDLDVAVAVVCATTAGCRHGVHQVAADGLASDDVLLELS